jgi:hypothetical protein
MITKNMGGADTALRATLGSLLIVLAAFAADQRPLLAFAAALVATAVLITAIAGVCPLYTVFGVDTRPGPRPQPRIRIKAEPAHQLR